MPPRKFVRGAKRSPFAAERLPKPFPIAQNARMQIRSSPMVFRNWGLRAVLLITKSWCRWERFSSSS
jgi:hypothetical protein